MQRAISAAGVAAYTLAFAAAASAQPMPPQAFPFKSGPVTIMSCSLGQAGNAVADNSLEIKYFQNVPRRHLVSVTFEIRYGGQVTSVTDSGTFSYDATIDHKFNVLGGVPWSGAATQGCRVVSAIFGDGRTVRPAYAGPGGAESRPMGGPNSGPMGGGPEPQGTVPPYATQGAQPPPPPAPAAT